jgi:multiple sugar transport system permease protein
MAVRGHDVEPVTVAPPGASVAARPAHVGGGRVSRWLLRDQSLGYVFIAPAFILLAVLVAYPFALALWLATSDSTVAHVGSFIGLRNFRELLHDDIFRQTIQNSFVFTAVSILAKTVFGLALALLLQRTLRFKRFVRGAILLPWVVPTALSTLAWWWMFDNTYSVFNWTLMRLGLAGEPVPWLADPYLAMASVITVNVWRGLPFFAVTILAGLVSIPSEIYDAANADGAGRLQRFAFITLPMLKPVLLIVTLFSTIFTVSDFNIVFVLTRGGPMNMTHLIATLSYAVGLSGGDIGKGAAISLAFFPILVAVVCLQLRMIRRDTTYMGG